MVNADGNGGSGSLPKSTYRDLLYAKANAEEVSDVTLELWRREEALLRCALEYPLQFRVCSVRPEHFGAPGHAVAWAAYLELVGARETERPVEPSVFLDSLRRVDPEMFAGLRGQTWVDLLYSEKPLPIEAGYGLMNELRQRALMLAWRRRFEELAARMDKETWISRLEADYVRAGLTVAKEAIVEKPTSEPLDALTPDLCSYSTSEIVPSGNETLDKIIGGGLGRGELVAIGGGTSHGKSYVGLDIAMRVAVHGGRSLILSMEDPLSLYYCRALSSFCEPRCRPVDIRAGHVAREILDAATKRMVEALGGRMYVEEMKKAPLEQVVEKMQLYRWVKQVDVVIVDYVQAVALDDTENRVQAMSRIVSELKREATKLRVALVLLSQYARDQYRDGTEPTINSFKYCGDLENEAEIVLLLWKDPDGVPYIKVPKVKWVRADDELRYVIVTDRVTGMPLAWQYEPRPAAAPSVPPRKRGKTQKHASEEG